MFNLTSNRTSVKVVNDTKYKLRRWSAITSNFEGFKLGKAFAPAFAMAHDLKSFKSEDQVELEDIHQDIGDMVFVSTGVVTRLMEGLKDEHFLDLQSKLLSGLSYYDNDKEDWVDISEDPSLHFDTEDFEGNIMEIFIWSLKENLWDFFMKQGTFATKIVEVIKTLPIQDLNLAEKNTPTS